VPYIVLVGKRHDITGAQSVISQRPGEKTISQRSEFQARAQVKSDRLHFAAASHAQSPHSAESSLKAECPRLLPAVSANEARHPVFALRADVGRILPPEKHPAVVHKIAHGANRLRGFCDRPDLVVEPARGVPPQQVDVVMVKIGFDNQLLAGERLIGRFGQDFSAFNCLQRGR
jgi:hypothetical protein